MFVDGEAKVSPSVSPLFNKQHLGSGFWRPTYGNKSLRIPLLGTYADGNMCNMAHALHKHFVDDLESRMLSTYLATRSC